MKSERRHELHTNMLADWLADTYEQVKPYQNAVLGTVLLVLVLVVGYLWWSRQSAARNAGAWEGMDQALSMRTQWMMRLGFIDPMFLGGEYEKVIQQHPRSAAADWAAVLAGDVNQSNGVNARLIDKAAANESLNKASEYYQLALRGKSAMLMERATFGLAQSLESQGKLEEAAKYYKEVTDKWPGGMFSVQAENRFKDLQKPTTKWFYDQLAAYNPVAPAPSKELPDRPGASSPLGPPPENPPDDSVFKYSSPFGAKLREKESKDKEAKDFKESPLLEEPPALPDEKTTGKPAEKATEKPVEEKPAEKTK